MVDSLFGASLPTPDSATPPTFTRVDWPAVATISPRVDLLGLDSAELWYFLGEFRETLFYSYDSLGTLGVTCRPTISCPHFSGWTITSPLPFFPSHAQKIPLPLLPKARCLLAFQISLENNLL